jgi:hypothetical protein
MSKDSIKKHFQVFLKSAAWSKDWKPKSDERKVEEAIERMYRSEQQDMFDDPDMNWSGLR